MKEIELEQYQIERLNPLQIETELAKNSLVYIPLGALEWHGFHLPIGLDSFTSHGICLRAANETKGLVMPPLYYGMTGSIWHHPYTILIEEDSVFLTILLTTLKRLEANGVRKVVIFTGHFALRQLKALEKLKKEWESINKSLKISILSISDCPNIEMEADHGAIFETSVLSQIHPELVKMDNLPTIAEEPANNVNGNSKGDHRRDPKNVLFGIFGDDPRNYEENKAKKILQKIINWLISEDINMKTTN